MAAVDRLVFEILGVVWLAVRMAQNLVGPKTRTTRQDVRQWADNKESIRYCCNSILVLTVPALLVPCRQRLRHQATDFFFLK